MKLLPLSKGLFAMVDDSDFELASQYKWYASGKLPDVYAARSERVGDRALNKKKTIYLHRIVAGAKSGDFVDHVNHNTLDNRRENLRTCTRLENLRNRKLTAGKLDTPYKGVRKENRSRMWVAMIVVAGELIRRHGFRTPEEAAREYDRMAKHYFGEFAWCNFPGALKALEEEHE